MSPFTEIKDKLVVHDQDHILKFFDELSRKEKVRYLVQLSSLNIEEVNPLFNRAVRSLSDGATLDKMEPIPPQQNECVADLPSEVVDAYQKTGFEEISNGHVAVITLAGGQGTRLGVSEPKGMCNLGLPSQKTLLQIQAERIRRLAENAKDRIGKAGTIYWYILLSVPTLNRTREYFEENNYFGLRKEHVVFFLQSLLPCYTFDGKLILEKKNSFALAPDGNGGMYEALKRSKTLEDMEEKGVKYIHIHSVDNILVKVADPIFIGYCISKGADFGEKVVKKENPTEPLGVVCKVNGRYQVVEYSEISKENSERRDQNGDLVYRAGNICNHFLTIGFLRKICSDTTYQQLKLHVAKKKIPYVNDKGETVNPEKPNGYKIEKFIFDVISMAENVVTFEVPRASEFSPVKNGDSADVDCCATARKDLLKLHKTYIQAVGGEVNCDQVEISPLLSYAGENLEKIRGQVFNTKTIIE